jgi:lycopene cyclase domain-containing protein
VKPNIAVFGKYTYLATIVLWGAITYGLLRRAGALKKAAVSVLAIYPVAYIWDWYTLEVGIFDIRLKTGIEVAGIPLEEHLFAVVVPALVIAIHENVHGVRDDARR